MQFRATKTWDKDFFKKMVKIYHAYCISIHTFPGYQNISIHHELSIIDNTKEIILYDKQ